MRSLPGVIFSQRADFSFEFASPRVLELTGIAAGEWMGQSRSFWQVVHEADAEELYAQCRRAMGNRQGVTTHFRLRNLATGQISHVLEHREAVVNTAGLLLGYEGFWLDVTRQQIAERRLSSAAWKETLATLTPGFGHDFNNLLAGILSVTDSLLAQVGTARPFAEGLWSIRQNTLQACHLLQRMMILHGCRTGQRGYHDLNEAVNELADLLRRVLPRRIVIETELAEQQLPLYVDVGELRQTILDLALNAAEAMPQPGKLHFQTRLSAEAMQPGHVQGTRPPPPCVCLRIRDTGVGIASRHLPLLFDPAFTTKPANGGSGLGLCHARRFVEKHGGAISVDSREGAGTAVYLWLPLADFSEAEQLRIAASQARPRLLLVGAPGLVHERTAELLRLQGYPVRQAFAPGRARDLLLAEHRHFHAVMILAGPTEAAFLAFAGELRSWLPELKIVLHLVGGDADQLPAELLPQLHLVIGRDANDAAVVSNLRLVLE